MTMGADYILISKEDLYNNSGATCPYTGQSEAEIKLRKYLKELGVSAKDFTESKGIKNHDGRCKAAEQKLLVQHILDNDKGLSDSSHMILEKLIEE